MSPQSCPVPEFLVPSYHVVAVVFKYWSLGGSYTPPSPPDVSLCPLYCGLSVAHDTSLQVYSKTVVTPRSQVLLWTCRKIPQPSDHLRYPRSHIPPSAPVTPLDTGLPVGTSGLVTSTFPPATRLGHSVETGDVRPRVEHGSSTRDEGGK